MGPLQFYRTYRIFLSYRPSARTVQIYPYPEYRIQKAIRIDPAPDALPFYRPLLFYGPWPY
jgi:hypothetical protein